VMMNLEGAAQPLPRPTDERLSLADRWILSRLDDAIRGVSGSIDAYEFNVAAMKIYQFIWHEFCDWYIELSKEPLKAGGERQAATRWVLINVFDKMLRVLHPFMPFVSEEIWQVVRPYIEERNVAAHLAIAKYPEASEKNPLSAEEATAMEHCIEATDAINSLRAFLGYTPGERAQAIVKPFVPQPGVISSEPRFERERLSKEFDAWKPYASTMAKSNTSLIFQDNTESRKGLLASVTTWAEVLVRMPASFNIGRARSALQKKVKEVQVHCDQDQSRLSDLEFTKKASPETRMMIQDRYGELLNQLHLLNRQLRQLEAAAQE
jgi:valyl-tRNA synthetase